MSLNSEFQLSCCWWWWSTPFFSSFKFLTTKSFEFSCCLWALVLLAMVIHPPSFLSQLSLNSLVVFEFKIDLSSLIICDPVIQPPISLLSTLVYELWVLLLFFVFLSHLNSYKSHPFFPWNLDLLITLNPPFLINLLLIFPIF